MSLRAGLSVGSTTDSSSLADQLKHFRKKEIRKPEKKGSRFLDYNKKKYDNSGIANETLAAKCIKQIVANFSELPVGDNIPVKYISEVTSKLPHNLKPKTAALYIHDEGYWKRRCIEEFGWQNCDISKHGMMWKQLFFEKYIQQRLEGLSQENEEIEDFLDEINSYSDFIFTLQFQQLPSHLDLSEVMKRLPNLTRLVGTYGMKNLGMDYERILFGCKISDASSLAKGLISHGETLVSLVLQSNLLDDDLLRMLMTGLMRNTSITHLDLAHNRITNHGARMLSRLLLEKTVLTHLDLSDNCIHTEGGRYLARALRSNDTLLDLNLRLNRLTDLGGQMLLDGLLDNSSLERLNLSCNGLGQSSVVALTGILHNRSSAIVHLDVSGNEIEDDHLPSIVESLEKNSKIASFDLRMNQITEEGNEYLKRIVEITYSNELENRLTEEDLMLNLHF